MNDVNKILITGVLCQDIELRFLPTGTKTANLRVAIHRKYKTKAKELKESDLLKVPFVVKVEGPSPCRSCGGGKIL